jgi:hypothetical protein
MVFVLFVIFSEGIMRLFHFHPVNGTLYRLYFTNNIPVNNLGQI